MSKAPQDPPKIEFPCDYLIKVIGDAEHDFPVVVCEVMAKHDESFDGQFTVRNSGKGTFASVNVTITATGEIQLAAIHADLQATGRVRMVI
ncbi:hypothetical protein EDC56_1806 [Sinobacterium caligoides]|uniref:UPF0250 protein EDC56_1806 n=1 Tax=Sinobacterium caligoides TaxID=933926 RepID=A0A3N2DPW7_9GAMM|nr:DUF493 domain-containing protein [Sinobacterium caligoides]ROS01365.1 hypothetical protein EDC56_1806 [Sinobacterium caligoides]